jgi:hypothetical protein
MEFLITTIVAVILLVGVVSECPSLCVCAEGTVYCKNKALHSIPTDLPLNSIVL